MTTTLILAMPDFNKVFVVECNASRNEIGAVLMQEAKPIAFISKAFSEKKSRPFDLWKRIVGSSIYNYQIESLLGGTTFQGKV